jgi:hypothetical protein
MIKLETPTLLDMLIVASQARDEEKEQYTVMFGREWIAQEVANECFNKDGAKFVFLDEDKPFVVGGWEPLIDGVWQSWMIGNMEYWETHWRTITKLSRKTMEIMFDGGARRLQTCATASRTKACEWYVRGLKMQPEGILRSFGMNGEDIAMFSKIRE